ncbi:hypothetical protein AAVH_21080 [Aphelenchoides avenae]|nr:hypothetical protein AAVH_21080 [Aphelenchus avenae]
MPDTTRILMDLLQLAHLMPPTPLLQQEAAEPPAKRRFIHPSAANALMERSNGLGPLRKLPLSEATNMRSRCGNHQPDHVFKKPPLPHGHAKTSPKN